MEKKMFRDSIVQRRCVIPSTGFFEWARDGKEKTKHLFNLPGSGVLYMAGCWNTFREKDGSEQQRFDILTTEANDSMKKDVSDLPLTLIPTNISHGEKIHDRMPVILRPEETQA